MPSSKNQHVKKGYPCVYLDEVYLEKVYFIMAMQSFNDRVAQDFFVAGVLKKGTGWSSLMKIVKRKLDILHYAAELDDLRAPPGNRLELLKGDLKGFHSIRINDQWRIVFRWYESGPHDVRTIDYH